MKTIRVFPRFTAVLLVLIVTIGAVAALARPASASTGAEQAYARDVVGFINAERSRRGLSPVSWTYSESLRSFMVGNCTTHSSGTIQEVIGCVYPNAGQPGGTAGGIVHMWMGSDGHNKRLTWANTTTISIGVFCDPATGVAHVAAQPDGGFVTRTPYSPSTTNYLAGAQCPGPQPAVTTPPATQPPATQPHQQPSSPPAPPQGTSSVGTQVAAAPSTPQSATPSVQPSATRRNPSTSTSRAATDSPGETAGGAGPNSVIAPSSGRLRDPEPLTRKRDTTEVEPASTLAGDVSREVASSRLDKPGDASNTTWWLAAIGLAAATGGVGVVMLRVRRQTASVPQS